MKPMKFFIGTTNKYKVREIASILRPLEIDLEVTDPIDPAETGSTFSENARIKARAYGLHVSKKLANAVHMRNPLITKADAVDFLLLSKIYTISEDSGLVIPALNGLPGHFSARFDDCDIKDMRVARVIESHRDRDEIDAANNQRVLNMMRGEKRRDAAFVVSLMVSDADGNIVFGTAATEHGSIAHEPAGRHGFGYDPIFISDNTYGKTWAEIDPMRKSLISHRRWALTKFREWVTEEIAKCV